MTGSFSTQAARTMLVTCPYCGARPQQPCINQRTLSATRAEPTTRPHIHRSMEADRRFS